MTWIPGTADTGNLGGTVRTLDGVSGPTTLSPGLISRDGWVVYDDSQTPILAPPEAGQLMALGGYPLLALAAQQCLLTLMLCRRGCTRAPKHVAA